MPVRLVQELDDTLGQSDERGLARALLTGRKYDFCVELAPYPIVQERIVFESGRMEGAVVGREPNLPGFGIGVHPNLPA